LPFPTLSQWGLVGCSPLSLNGGRDFFIFWPISRPQLRPYFFCLVFPIESQWGMACNSPLSLSMGAVRLFPIQLNGGRLFVVLARFTPSDRLSLSRLNTGDTAPPLSLNGGQLPVPHSLSMGADILSPIESQWGTAASFFSQPPPVRPGSQDARLRLDAARPARWRWCSCGGFRPERCWLRVLHGGPLHLPVERLLAVFSTPRGNF